MMIGALPVTIALLLRGQETPEAPPIALRVQHTLLVEEGIPRPYLAVLGPLKCDASGNLYVRYYSRADRLAAPIEKITHEGKLPARFAVRSVPGLEKAFAYDFAVGGTGEVYFLTARREGGREIVKLTEAGKYDSSFELQPYLRPRSLAVFPSGELLVSGEELSLEEKKPTGRLLLALYDHSGKFLREVSLPRDIQWVVPPEEGDTPPQASPEENAASLTTAQPADDGNIYVMRPVANPLVYVIAPGGSVLRRIEIQPPGKGFRATTMKAGAGMVAIEFAKDTREPTGDIYVYSIVNVYTGEKFADYSLPSGVRGIWACYTPDGFTFLSSRGNPPRLTIVKARP